MSVPKKPTGKAKTVRPVVLVTSVDQARAIVAKKYTQDYADKLGDGDVIDLALHIVSSDDG